MFYTILYNTLFYDYSEDFFITLLFDLFGEFVKDNIYMRTLF